MQLSRLDCYWVHKQLPALLHGVHRAVHRETLHPLIRKDFVVIPTLHRGQAVSALPELKLKSS